MPVYIILVPIVVLVVLYVSVYNTLRRLSVKVEEGSAGIDVALEKRYDMLSEEIEAVKKFLKHEYDTYMAVTSVRAGKELEEEAFREKKAISEEALKTIDETIKAQQEQMERIKRKLEKQKKGKEGKREAYEKSAAEQKMKDVYKRQAEYRFGFLP